MTSLLLSSPLTNPMPIRTNRFIGKCGWSLGLAFQLTLSSFFSQGSRSVVREMIFHCINVIVCLNVTWTLLTARVRDRCAHALSGSLRCILLTTCWKQGPLQRQSPKTPTQSHKLSRAGRIPSSLTQCYFYSIYFSKFLSCSIELKFPKELWRILHPLGESLIGLKTTFHVLQWLCIIFITKKGKITFTKCYFN